jgi:hypothetical protein
VHVHVCVRTRMQGDMRVRVRENAYARRHAFVCACVLVCVWRVHQACASGMCIWHVCLVCASGMCAYLCKCLCVWHVRILMQMLVRGHERRTARVHCFPSRVCALVKQCVMRTYIVLARLCVRMGVGVRGHGKISACNYDHSRSRQGRCKPRRTVANAAADEYAMAPVHALG